MADSFDELRERMRSMGISPDRIESVLREPAAQGLINQLQSQLKTNTTQSAQQLQAGYETTPDGLRNQMNAVKSRFEEEKNRIPHKAEIRNREQLLLATRAERTIVRDESLMIYQSYCGMEKSFSDKSLPDLERVLLRDMLVPKTHSGQYLLARVISPPYRRLGVNLIIEDPSGRAELLSIYNYPIGNTKSGTALDDFFPLGSIIAIREPVYKTAAEGPATLIRVDSPTDIIFLSPRDSLVENIKWKTYAPTIARPPSTDFKTLGNDLFKAKRYQASTMMYTEGIENSIFAPQPVHLLYLNRAAAHLELHNYTSAYRDSEKAFELLKNTNSEVALKVKTLLRRAKSLEGLRLFTQAQHAFSDILLLDVSNKEAVTSVLRMKARLKESNTGEYDWKGMFKIGTDFSTKPRLDVGNFVGPIEVVDLKSKGGGRGIRATRDIKVGELLAVEKAFWSEYPPLKGKEAQVMALNFATMKADKASQVGLASSVAAKLMENPQLLEQLYSLYAGPSSSAPSPFNIKFITAPVAPSMRTSQINIDIKKVEDICGTNSFGHCPTSLATYDDNQNDAETSSTLYLLCSLFNHSCIANANWSSFADVMVIRARKSIPKGSEVLISYVNPGNPLAKRKAVLSKHLDNTPAGKCTCDICKLDELDGNEIVSERARLVKKLVSLQTVGPKGVTMDRINGREFKRLLVTLEKTYSSRSKSTNTSKNFKPDLFEPYHMYSLWLNNTENKYDESIEYSLKGLASIGIKFDRIKGARNDEIKFIEIPPVHGSEVVMILISFAANYGVRDKLEESTMWMRAAIDVEKLYSGGGKDYFEMRYQAILNHLGLKEVFNQLELLI